MNTNLFRFEILKMNPIYSMLLSQMVLINVQCSRSFLEIFSSLDKYYNVDTNLLYFIDFCYFTNFIYFKIPMRIMNHLFNPLKILKYYFGISNQVSPFLRFFDSYFQNNNLFYNSKESHIFQ